MAIEMNLQRGLVGHWTMDDVDTTGGAVSDSSPYGNNMSSTSGLTTGVSSPLGQAHSYDGTATTSGSATAPDEFNSVGHTIMGWVKYDSTGSGGSGNFGNVVIAGFDFEMALYADVDSTSLKYYINPSDASSSTILQQSFSFDTWIHVCGVRDGSNAEFYIDGVSVATGTTDGTVACSPTEFRIADYNSTSSPLEGDISDIRVYNRALNESEINALYQMRTQRNAYL